MVRLALLAFFSLNIGTPSEAQMPDGIDRLSEQGLPSSDVTMFLRHLENIKKDGMDQPEQSAWKPRTFSDTDHLFTKLDGSLDSSNEPKTRGLFKNLFKLGKWFTKKMIKYQVKAAKKLPDKNLFKLGKWFIKKIIKYQVKAAKKLPEAIGM